MTSRTMLTASSALIFLALAPFAFAAQEDAAEEPVPAEAAETPEQKAARELCMGEAEPGAYPGWSIRRGETCQNSYANVCTIVRASDGAEASYTCYVPPPMPEEEPAPEPQQE